MLSTLPPALRRWPVFAVEEAFPAVPDAAAQARSFLRAAAAEWQLPDDVVADCVQIVSEIVGNVIRHAQTPLTLRLSYDGEAVLIASTDGAVRLPEQHTASDVSEDGRGLLIIDSVASSWGVHHAVVGKTMWARVEVS